MHQPLQRLYNFVMKQIIDVILGDYTLYQIREEDQDDYTKLENSMKSPLFTQIEINLEQSKIHIRPNQSAQEQFVIDLREIQLVNSMDELPAEGALNIDPEDEKAQGVQDQIQIQFWTTTYEIALKNIGILIRKPEPREGDEQASTHEQEDPEFALVNNLELFVSFTSLLMPDIYLQYFRQKKVDAKYLNRSDRVSVQLQPVEIRLQKGIYLNFLNVYYKNFYYNDDFNQQFNFSYQDISDLTEWTPLELDVQLDRIAIILTQKQPLQEQGLEEVYTEEVNCDIVNITLDQTVMRYQDDDPETSSFTIIGQKIQGTFYEYESIPEDINYVQRVTLRGFLGELNKDTHSLSLE